MFVRAERSRHLVPELVEHLQLGITWEVTGILGCWAHPARSEETLGRPVLTGWWVLKVSRPLPDRPGEAGEFVMEVTGCGHQRPWWIKPRPARIAQNAGFA
jgi:hypothetical protein